MLRKICSDFETKDLIELLQENMGDFGKALVKLNVGGTIFETRLETLDRGCKQGSQVRVEPG